MEIKDLYKIYLQHPSIKIDTRKLVAGDIFFALKGPNFNGNHFSQNALDAGAAYVITDEEINLKDGRIIKTADALTTLQMLANHHREQFNIPFIAITGSNGKTTTKELLHQVLSTSYKTYTTTGNLNNHIGVPLTILSIKKDAEMAVIEMGANHANEIQGYCNYTKPTHGLITNIGKAHLEGFGSIEGVQNAKGELFDYLKQNNGIAFVNADDSKLIKPSNGIKNIISYGVSGIDVQGNVTDNAVHLLVAITANGQTKYIKTKLVGGYNLLNVIAAFTVGKHFNISNEKIKAAIENYSPSNSRSQLIMEGTNTIILDAYNANPGSMKAAIENFAAMQGDNKILLLGSMMELGKDSENEHIEIIKLIDKYKWKQVVLAGENFKKNHLYIHLNNSEEVKKWLQQQQFQNAQILIKGSRSMQMEKVLEAD